MNITLFTLKKYSGYNVNIVCNMLNISRFILFGLCVKKEFLGKIAIIYNSDNEYYLYVKKNK